VCPSGYIDHTQGRGAHWACGVACPGQWPWTDIWCGCACVLPSQCVSTTADDPCVTRGEEENRNKLPSDAPAPTYGTVPGYETVPTYEMLKSRYPSFSTPAPRPRGFLGATTTPAPMDDNSRELWIIVTSLVAVVLVCASVITCFKFGMSWLTVAHEPPTPTSYVSPAPAARCLRGSEPSPSASVAPMPHLLKSHVQPKAAWADVKEEDCMSSVSTRSPCSSVRENAAALRLSARSRSHSPQPSPRPRSHSPQPSPRPRPCSSPLSLTSGPNFERSAKQQLSLHVPAASQRPGTQSPRLGQSPRSKNPTYGVRLAPIPGTLPSPSPRSSNSASRLPSPRAEA